MPDLSELLDVSPDHLSFLDSFAPDDREALEVAVAAALARDDEAIDHGLAHALKLIPRPLRGRAARLLG